jgi:hypothetical protein
MINEGRRGINHIFDDQDEFGMDGRDPMDDLMGRIEREFFGANSGLFGMMPSKNHFSRFDFNEDQDHQPQFSR